MKLELLENGVQYFDIGAKKHLLFSAQNIDKAENNRYALLFKFTPNPFKGLGQQTVYDVIKMFSESEMVEEKPTPIKQVFLESPNMIALDKFYPPKGNYEQDFLSHAYWVSSHKHFQLLKSIPFLFESKAEWNLVKSLKQETIDYFIKNQQSCHFNNLSPEMYCRLSLEEANYHRMVQLKLHSKISLWAKSMVLIKQVMDVNDVDKIMFDTLRPLFAIKSLSYRDFLYIFEKTPFLLKIMAQDYMKNKHKIDDEWCNIYTKAYETFCIMVHNKSMNVIQKIEKLKSFEKIFESMMNYREESKLIFEADFFKNQNIQNIVQGFQEAIFSPNLRIQPLINEIDFLRESVNMRNCAKTYFDRMKMGSQTQSFRLFFHINFLQPDLDNFSKKGLTCHLSIQFESEYDFKIAYTQLSKNKKYSLEDVWFDVSMVEIAYFGNDHAVDDFIKQEIIHTVKSHLKQLFLV